MRRFLSTPPDGKPSDTSSTPKQEEASNSSSPRPKEAPALDPPAAPTLDWNMEYDASHPPSSDTAPPYSSPAALGKDSTDTAPPSSSPAAPGQDSTDTAPSASSPAAPGKDAASSILHSGELTVSRPANTIESLENQMAWLLEKAASKYPMGIDYNPGVLDLMQGADELAWRKTVINGLQDFVKDLLSEGIPCFPKFLRIVHMNKAPYQAPCHGLQTQSPLLPVRHHSGGQKIKPP